MRSRRAHRFALLLIPLYLLLSCRIDRGAGTTIEPASPPRRIIALTPSLVEILFALGLGDRVAGVGNYVFYPPEAASKPRIGGLFDPNLERIVSLKPDLAVLLPSERDLGRQLRPLGVDILVVPDETLADVEGSFLTIARRCGVPEAGERLAARWRADLAPQLLPGPPLKVMVSVGRSAGRLGEVTVAARRTFYDELLTRLGAVNVFADAPTRYPQVNLEEIVARKPDVILELRPDPLTPDRAAAVVNDWNTLSQIPAVRNGRVKVISGDFTMLPGPRLGRLYREMRGALAESLPEPVSWRPAGGAGLPFEASPPVPLSLTGEGERRRWDIAEKAGRLSVSQVLNRPPSPVRERGTGGEASR
ncbi:MAG TPA: helical backbone metal receptor, partial [Thermoanaerobaculia bacterium]|nr:helical backbone metal receptor [Thermoanaerobaculia bacterium]